MPQADHSLGALVGKPFVSLSTKILDRWSTSLLTGLLHSTWAILSQETPLATLVAFEIRQQIWGCQRKRPQMGRNVSRIEVQNCGIASQLRLSRHPPLQFSNIIYNGLGFFLAVGGLPRPLSLCLVSAGWWWRFILDLCRQSGGSRAWGRGLRWLLDRGRNSQSIGFMHFFFYFS